MEPSALFSKIRLGQYNVPDSVSSRAKCLIRSMLRRDPGERLCAAEVLQHPWIVRGTNHVPHPKYNSSSGGHHHHHHHSSHSNKDVSSREPREPDQTVPQMPPQVENRGSLFS